MASRRVLIVEDSQFMAGQLSERLATHNIETESSQTAVGAREALAAGDIDCVLVNYDLPDESGLSFAQSVPSATPVILLTATTLEDIASEAVEAGVTEFVHKDDLATGSVAVLANRIEVAIRATQAAQ